MLKYLKIYIASILFIYFILFGWIESYKINCLMILFPIVVAIVISYSFIELKMHDRLCFRDCFLKDRSIFALMLSSRWFVTIVYIIISLIMTISAMVASIDIDEKIWLYIFTLHILSVIMLQKIFDSLLYGSVKGSYRRLIAREWTIHITSIVLMVVTVYVYYNGYEPIYIQSGLRESIISASNSRFSNCLLLDSLLKIEREVDALFWWMITNGSEYIESSLLKFGAWLLFLLFNSLAILGINRFIVQVVYMIDKIFRESGSER